MFPPDAGAASAKETTSKEPNMRSQYCRGSAAIYAFIAVCALLTGCVSCPSMTAQPSGDPVNEVIQEFPAGKPMQTAWKVRFAHGTGKGLYITGAFFKRNASENWVRVLWDARLAEMFVPYHPGSPRYHDLSMGFGLEPANANDAGKCGRVIDTYVVKEVRDRGPAWKDDQAVHRGHELVLWATVDAANYNYVIQYLFRDDGSIGFRVGATSRNLPGMEYVAHGHQGLWRVDIDLAGAGNDSAMIMRHSESTASPSATDSMVAFNSGVEGAADWNALEFTEVAVVDTQILNDHQRKIGYDLMPMRSGSPRHQEPFAHHDFWVTRYRGNELTYELVPQYVQNAESISNTDVVLWHVSPMHHLPRDEDGMFVGGSWRGVALLMWSGFDLRPRNFFSRTPLFPY
jgi:Cu2+-containing amine oxidase